MTVACTLFSTLIVWRTLLVSLYLCCTYITFLQDKRYLFTCNH